MTATVQRVEQIARIIQADIVADDDIGQGLVLCLAYGTTDETQQTMIVGLDEDTPNGRRGSAYGCEFLRRLLAAAGVSLWSQLPGRTVLALFDPPADDEASFGFANEQPAGLAPLPTEAGTAFVFAELGAEYGIGEAP